MNLLDARGRSVGVSAFLVDPYDWLVTASPERAPNGAWLVRMDVPVCFLAYGGNPKRRSRSSRSRT